MLRGDNEVTSDTSSIDASAVAVPLNDATQAQATLDNLVAKSPLQDPRPVSVFIRKWLLKHLQRHSPPDFSARQQRMAWIEPTITKPFEIRESRIGYGFTYVACFKGMFPAMPERRQYFVIITECQGQGAEVTVKTAYPTADKKFLEGLRKEACVWPKSF